MPGAVRLMSFPRGGVARFDVEAPTQQRDALDVALDVAFAAGGEPRYRRRLAEFACAQQSSICVYAASRPDIGRRDLARLARDASPAVRCVVAKHPDTAPPQPVR